VPRLSIIIPTLGNWEDLESTLVSVLQNRPAQSEIVVVHKGTYHDPYDLKDEVRFVSTGNGCQLVDLVNAGLVAAHAEIIHLLSCGAVAEEGWTAPAVRQFEDSRVASVAPLVLDADCPSRVFSAGCQWWPGGVEAIHAHGQLGDAELNHRRWVGPDGVAAFYRRSALCDVGSLDATLTTRFAAIDLALRLRNAGYRAALEANSRVMIAPSLVGREGSLRQAWQRERLFWRHARQHGRLRSLAAHSGQIASEIVRCIPRATISEAVGRAIGIFDRRAPRTRPIEPITKGSICPLERRIDAAHARPPAQRVGGAGVTSKVRSI
jgi:GT2 family glycosyltransferase